MEENTNISMLNQNTAPSLQSDSVGGDNRGSCVPISLEPEPLLSEDGNNVLLHIPVESQNANVEAEEEEAQVFLIYQDLFTCGACSKQCVDLLAFIQHKGTHCLAENIYRCELCKSIHGHQEELAEHYHMQHGVHLQFEPSEDTADHITSNGVLDKSLDPEPANEEKMTVLLTNLEENELNGVTLENPKSEQTSDVNIIPKLDISEDESGQGEVSLIKMEMDLTSVVLPEGHTDVHVNQQQQQPQQEQHTIQTPIIKPIIKLPVTASNLSEANDSGLVEDAENDTQSLDTEVPHEAGQEEGETGETDGGKTLRDIDFNFVLQTEEIRGKTLWYGRNSFKCLHCDFKSRTKARFKTHMVDKHSDMLPFHENLHASKGGEKDNKRVMKMSQYESMYCKRPRLTHGKRKRKIEKQDIPGVYPCVQCKKVFSRLRYLRKHDETHRTENKFTCEDCGKSFKSRTYLRVHKRVHLDKVFKCNQCDFSSTINAAIQAHRQIHNQGSVICDICGYAYTDKSTLNKHKRVHDLSRPFACNYPGCTWRFKTEIMCKAHIRAHTTEGKFRCSHCGYLFRHKHHLQRHETNKHGIQHVKTRTNQLRDAKFYENNNEDCQMASETISVVIGNDINSEHLGLSQASLSCQQLVIATESQDNLVNYAESGDMSALQTAYDSFIQTQDITDNSENVEGKTIMVVHPEAQIVFQEN